MMHRQDITIAALAVRKADITDITELRRWRWVGEGVEKMWSDIREDLGIWTVEVEVMFRRGRGRERGEGGGWTGEGRGGCI